MTKIISKIFAMKSAAGKRTKNDHDLCFLFDRENDSCSLQLKNGKRHVEIKELR